MVHEDRLKEMRVLFVVLDSEHSRLAVVVAFRSVEVIAEGGIELVGQSGVIDLAVHEIFAGFELHVGSDVREIGFNQRLEVLELIVISLFGDDDS